MTVASVFEDYVAPAIGNVLAVILLVSPTPAVLRAKRIQHLEHLNVLPFPGTLCVGIAYVGYGLVLPDMWLVPANIIGSFAGLWFSLTVIPLLKPKARDYMTVFLLGSLLFFSIYATIGVFAVSQHAREQMWGILTVVILLTYYALPLSSLGTVIKTRNSASIYLPLAVAAILNGTAWTIYGFLAVKDLYVWLPNVLGAVLGILQVIVRLTIPATDYDHGGSEAAEPVTVHTNGIFSHKSASKSAADGAPQAVHVLVHHEDGSGGSAVKPPSTAQ